MQIPLFFVVIPIVSLMILTLLSADAVVFTIILAETVVFTMIPVVVTITLTSMRADTHSCTTDQSFLSAGTIVFLQWFWPP